MQSNAFSVCALLGALLAAGLPAGALTAQPAAQNKDAPAAEQGVTRLGASEGWSAYLDAEKGRKVCYLEGEPSKSEPAGAKRAKIFASVTHRPQEKTSNEVSFNAGYAFKEGSDAELLVDGKKFSLFTNKEAAWSRDAATDKAVVEALSKGKQAVIKGTSARGTATTDTYTLAGFSQALAQIDKACGVKR
ncbi:MAG TPA: invasion associated locus B family protein [Stellaceae bacterium]|nr:invasion associated locus B family protein [Stellaceae bacterium]